MTSVDSLDAVIGLERRLLSDEHLRFDVRLRSSELVTSRLEGSIELGPQRCARIALEGEWESLPARIESTGDGRQLVVVVADRRTEVALPGQFRDVLAVGFVRLGLWETVFRTMKGDRMPSGERLQRRLRLGAPALEPPEATRPDLSSCLGHAFTIREGGVTSERRRYGLIVMTATPRSGRNPWGGPS